MKKSLFLTILTMVVLFFLWWFSGGTIIGLTRNPAPVEVFISFLTENFQIGLATVFNSLSKILGF